MYKLINKTRLLKRPRFVYSIDMDRAEHSSSQDNFAVTEVYVNREDAWKLIQFTFTALVY